MDSLISSISLFLAVSILGATGMKNHEMTLGIARAYADGNKMKAHTKCRDVGICPQTFKGNTRGGREEIEKGQKIGKDFRLCGGGYVHKMVKFCSRLYAEAI